MPKSINETDSNLFLDTKNFGLTEHKFEVLLESLKKGDETMFEAVFLSHYEKCMNYIILSHQASRENAYDATMWTLIQFRKRLIEGKINYGNMNFYFTKMAVNKYFSIVKKGRIFKFSNDKDFSDIPDTEEDNEHEHLFVLMEKAWEEMCVDCKEILRKFYYDKMQLKEISKLINDSSEANTRKKKERCIKKLRSFFFEIKKETDKNGK